jgi:hypothetical protein
LFRAQVSRGCGAAPRFGGKHFGAILRGNFAGPVFRTVIDNDQFELLIFALTQRFKALP